MNEIKFRTPEMATLGLSKVFILDKYFTELQKFWETEKKLQGTKLQNCDREYPPVDSNDQECPSFHS